MAFVTHEIWVPLEKVAYEHVFEVLRKYGRLLIGKNHVHEAHSEPRSFNTQQPRKILEKVPC